MNTWPLAIVQARIGSTRLPGKMLLDLGGKPLIWHAWNAAVQAFGLKHVITAIPASAENDELAGIVEGFGGQVFRWDGPENDVLGRFHACARRYRWHPDSILVRVTPDDPWKDPDALLRVANGERLPVELGGEAFTLAMLDGADQRERASAPAGHPLDLLANRRRNANREHLTHALFPTAPPPPPPGIWTIDTPEDYEAAKKRMADES